MCCNVQASELGACVVVGCVEALYACDSSSQYWLCTCSDTHVLGLATRGGVLTCMRHNSTCDATCNVQQHAAICTMKQAICNMQYATCHEQYEIRNTACDTTCNTACDALHTAPSRCTAHSPTHLESVPPVPGSPSQSGLKTQLQPWCMPAPGQSTACAQRRWRPPMASSGVGGVGCWAIVVRSVRDSRSSVEHNNSIVPKSRSAGCGRRQTG